VIVTADKEPPAILHSPIAAADPGKPLTIRARVSDPSGVDRVVLRYRGLSRAQEYATIPMLRSSNGSYAAEIPPLAIDLRWDLMYFIEAYDKVGNGKIYPDLNGRRRMSW
jgi:hypothetical protein